jgi:hypothetical protein
LVAEARAVLVECRAMARAQEAPLAIKAVRAGEEALDYAPRVVSTEAFDSFLRMMCDMRAALREGRAR